VASNLFFLALPRTAETMWRAGFLERKRAKTVPPVLWLSVLASLVTVFLVPTMTGRSMLWAVLTSHPAQASIGWDVWMPGGWSADGAVI